MNEIYSMKMKDHFCTESDGFYFNLFGSLKTFDIFSDRALFVPFSRPWRSSLRFYCLFKFAFLVMFI